MPDESSSEVRLSKWQELSAWPMILLSFTYVAVYVGPIYWYPLSNSMRLTFHVAEYAVWAIFIIDYLIQLQLSIGKRAFLRREWFSLLLIAFPFFRPVRAVRGIVFLRQASTRKASLVRSLPAILGSMAVLLVIIAGAAVLNAERFAHGATIKTPSDALWWAVTAITTSGGGNLAPITNEGRIIAACLLVFGLGLLTSMTGYVASWVLHEFNVVRETQPAEKIE
ncbi:MAG TPA: ion channel [Acidimicrobiales bacterium]|jgi:voltage-gated potassium channel|nr:ion channel [Acidimicrobiales bacterium]